MEALLRVVGQLAERIGWLGAGKIVIIVAMMGLAWKQKEDFRLLELAILLVLISVFLGYGVWLNGRERGTPGTRGAGKG